MSELVEIVDENNNVIGRVTREEAHEKGLLHRCVIAELKDKSGNWVFVKQAPTRQDKGQLASAVGGHIENGESIENSLKREVFEEIGIKDFKFKHKGNIIFNRKVLNHIENHYFIVYEISSDEEIILNEESVEYEKFSDEELKIKVQNEPEYFGSSLLYIFRHLYPYLLTTAVR